MNLKLSNPLAHRWNDLLSTLKERTKFLQDLKDFQDSQDAMNNWLNQKEKMFQVLGPIASDPRMVQSQIQQVQVRLLIFSKLIKPLIDIHLCTVD